MPRAVRNLVAAALVIYVWSGATPAVTEAGHAVFHAFAAGAVRYGGVGGSASVRAHSHEGLAQDDPHLVGDHLSGRASDHSHAPLIDALLRVGPSVDELAVSEDGSAPAPPLADLHVPVTVTAVHGGPDSVKLSFNSHRGARPGAPGAVPVPPPRA